MPSKAKVQILQAVLASAQEVLTLEVLIPGEEEPVTFRYKRLTWLQKSRILSEATEYRPAIVEKDGKQQTMVTVVLHQDIYSKLALQAMLIDPPIPMTDTVLEGLPPEIGAQFDTIIPNPMTMPVAEASKKD
jgi:hypothetical protein